MPAAMRYQFSHGAYRAPGWALVLLLHGAVLWALVTGSGSTLNPQDLVLQTLLIQEVEIVPARTQPPDPPIPSVRHSASALKPVPPPPAGQTPESAPLPIPLARPTPSPSQAPLAPSVPLPTATTHPSPGSPVPPKETLIVPPIDTAVQVPVAPADRASPPRPPVPLVVRESRVAAPVVVPERVAAASQFPAAAFQARDVAPATAAPHMPAPASESRAASARTHPEPVPTGALQTTKVAGPGSRTDSVAAAPTAYPERPAVPTQAGLGSTPNRSPTPESTATPVSSAIAVACPVQVAPEMPSGVYREQGDEWQVTAQIAIHNGAVQSVKILSGPRVFHDKVREAIRKYQCKADGTEVLATQVFRFKLGQ